MSRSLRFVCISDTHGKHDSIDVPDGDVLIHAGDFTHNGTHRQIQRFNDWLGSLPHRHKIVIAGNHELSLDAPWYLKYGRKRHREFHDPVISKQILKNCTYLENTSIMIDDTIHIFGSPNTPAILGCVM
jgi:hypothetical protein